MNKFLVNSKLKLLTIRLNSIAILTEVYEQDSFSIEICRQNVHGLPTDWYN